ncbi:MAG: Zn-dependent hydrolase [Bradyrhizobiaceae bacterium]|nr:MAG: Zn-dependent hydrolase [Bradyrhizobiaceae bacterium]
MATLPIAQFVDGERLWQRHMALARFGALANGGVNRQALSEEEIAARAELVRWGRAIGLAPFTDAAGNLFLRLEGRDPSLPPVLVGSHIDSQPSGGKFDGVFGVLAALEVQEAFRASGRTPLRAIETVAWMNEEGSRFAPGMMGSALYAGARSVAEVLAVRDPAGESVETALKALLARDVDVPHRALGRPAAAFLEAHIEQGPVLELEGKTVGVVTGIQGKRTFRATVTGEENHAGTAPRSVRRDALLAAAAMIGALDVAMRDAEDVTRFTVGRLEVTPNAPSVVAAKAVFSIDLRHPDAGTLQRLGDRIADICRAQAGPCEVAVAQLLHDPPLSFPRDIRNILAKAAAAVGAPWMAIASGAGHDARYLHYFCPTGMIFVPCRNGISHNEAEWAEKDHLAAGARVLAEAAAVLASNGAPR